MYKDKTAEELTIEDLQLMALETYPHGFGPVNRVRRGVGLQKVFRTFGYGIRHKDIARVSERLLGIRSIAKDATFFLKVFEKVKMLFKKTKPKQRSPEQMQAIEAGKRRNAEIRRQRNERSIRSKKTVYPDPKMTGNRAANDDDAFYDSWEWKRARYEALKMHGAKCMLCGATADDGARICVDHIKPRAIYPELQLDIANLQILCNDCNMGKGRWDQTDWRKRDETAKPDIKIRRH